MSRSGFVQHRRLGFAVCLLLFGILASGCGQTTDNESRYVPSPEVAESAVKASMEAWLKGELDHLIAGTKPAVQVNDPHRIPAQTLVRYEILGEVAGNAPRCYAVKIRLKSQADDTEKDLRLKYVVTGIDPLVVWEQHDYDMLSHWDHNMKDPAPPETPKK